MCSKSTFSGSHRLVFFGIFPEHAMHRPVLWAGRGRRTSCIQPLFSCYLTVVWQEPLTAIGLRTYLMGAKHVEIMHTQMMTSYYLFIMTMV